MKAEKRRWIYAGLSVPPGVAAVSRAVLTAVSAAAGPTRVLLVGGKVAKNLAAPLRRLAQGTPIQLEVDADEHCRLADWEQRLPSSLLRFEPSVVLLGMEPDLRYDAMVRHASALPLWLAPRVWGGMVAVQPPKLGGTMAPTAASYAAWAAAVWQTVLQD